MPWGAKKNGLQGWFLGPQRAFHGGGWGVDACRLHGVFLGAVWGLKRKSAFCVGVQCVLCACCVLLGKEF